MAGTIVPLPGTKDVTADLQNRTNLQPTDQLMLVNPTTKEVQVVTIQQLSTQGGFTSFPNFSNNSNFQI